MQNTASVLFENLPKSCQLAFKKTALDLICTNAHKHISPLFILFCHTEAQLESQGTQHRNLHR